MSNSFTIKRLQDLEKNGRILSNLETPITCEDCSELNVMLADLVSLNKKRKEILKKLEWYNRESSFKEK